MDQNIVTKLHNLGTTHSLNALKFANQINFKPRLFQFTFEPFSDLRI